MQRPLPDNTQLSQETDIHVLGGIRASYEIIRGVDLLSGRTS